MTEVNADQAELAKFSALAHQWWDLQGEFAALHQINPLRLDWIDAACPLNGQRVLDVGCGGGILADAMARRGADVLGIDLAEKSLKVAQLHALETQTPHVAYRCVSAEALSEEMPGAFDVVTCMEMLEHVPDPASVVAACARLVAHHGAGAVQRRDRGAPGRGPAGRCRRGLRPPGRTRRAARGGRVSRATR